MVRAAVAEEQEGRPAGRQAGPSSSSWPLLPESPAAGGGAPAGRVAGLRVHLPPSLASAEGVLAACGELPRGGADLVTLAHGLVSEDEWSAKLELALALLRPGGLLAVCDLAPAGGTPPGAPPGARARARAAFWHSASPRSSAPHHPAVLARLRAATRELHCEHAPASAVTLRAAYFVYVGRK